MKANWPADKVERRPIDALIPYANNARTHSDEQVAQIAASMREWGWTNPVLVDEVGLIIAGHGRVLAARKLGLAEVPVMVAEGWTEAQKKAYVLADNQLVLNAGWDTDLLSTELKGLDELGFDLELIGFTPDEMADVFLGLGDGGESDAAPNYSRKIEAPIYEPKGDCPPVSALYDESKANEMKAEIEAAELPDDVRAFLFAAADRHTVFNFRNIAEFYAHADAETQDLMERSALVIIDYARAIEEGYVRLSKGMLEQSEKSKVENYA